MSLPDVRSADPMRVHVYPYLRDRVRESARNVGVRSVSLTCENARVVATGTKQPVRFVPRLGTVFLADGFRSYASSARNIEQGSREVVRVALLGPDGPTGTFTCWENEAISW